MQVRLVCALELIILMVRLTPSSSKPVAYSAVLLLKLLGQNDRIKPISVKIYDTGDFHKVSALPFLQRTRVDNHLML
jgi:hypothetical protein